MFKMFTQLMNPAYAQLTQHDDTAYEEFKAYTGNKESSVRLQKNLSL